MVEGYILPFKDNPVMISQGYNGPWSHRLIRKNTDQSYSLDFALPLGTEVMASRQGTLRFFCDHFKRYYLGNDFENGCNYTANFIEVEHSDGSIACYQHLQEGSVSECGLKAGCQISRGQVLGKTGLSGWIGSVPHLHFMVYDKRPMLFGDRIIRAMRTKPVDFDDYKGPLEHRVVSGVK